MTTLSKDFNNWRDLPPEIKDHVIGKMDIVGKIKLSRTSKDEYDSVEACKEPIEINRIDLKIKNGYAEWVIDQTNEKIIQVEYNEVENYVTVSSVGSIKTEKIQNRSALDQSLKDLTRILNNSCITTAQFRLFLTADDRNFSADRAHQHFNTLCFRFGRMTHKLKVKTISIDYSAFTVYEEDMIRGLTLLDPKHIDTIAIEGDENGAILNTKHVMDCDVWKFCKHLICSPAIRQLEAFWDKPDVKSGLVVENAEFMPKLITHLQTKTDLQQIIIEITYQSDEHLEPEDLTDLLLIESPRSSYYIQNETMNQRHYTIAKKGHHLKMEVTETDIRFFCVKNG